VFHLGCSKYLSLKFITKRIDLVHLFGLKRDLNDVCRLFIYLGSSIICILQIDYLVWICGSSITKSIVWFILVHRSVYRSTQVKKSKKVRFKKKFKLKLKWCFLFSVLFHLKINYLTLEGKGFCALITWVDFLDNPTNINKWLQNYLI
jgi:hypothetical protein